MPWPGACHLQIYIYLQIYNMYKGIEIEKVADFFAVFNLLLSRILLYRISPPPSLAPLQIFC